MSGHIFNTYSSSSFHPAWFCDRITMISYSKMTDSVGSVIRGVDRLTLHSRPKFTNKKVYKFVAARAADFRGILPRTNSIMYRSLLWRKAVRIANTTLKLCRIDRARWVDGPSIFYFVPTRPHRKERSISVQRKTAFYFTRDPTNRSYGLSRSWNPVSSPFLVSIPCFFTPNPS